MSTRAICIPFHRYHPHTTEHYRVWMNALLNGLELWKDEFDKLYLIDDYWNFNFEELDRLNKLGINYEIIKRQKDGHHWVQFQTAFPYIKEDLCLFLDNDVLIWKRGTIKNWFDIADMGVFVTAFDGSGGMEEIMNKVFPQLHGAHRMGSYYFILTQEQIQMARKVDLAPVHYKTGTYIPELDYTTVEGDWQDSFGILTYKILSQNGAVYEIKDDRSSIYYESGKINKDPEEPLRLGYYHVRNGGHTTYLLSSKYSGAEEDYKHSITITPQRELLRIMAWHHIAGSGIHQNEIAEILRDINVSQEDWDNYLSEVIKYHEIVL